jgi:Tol biopolymer transport system component/DNA-binding winged helix-turn-helix (wHTH) protein
MNEQQKRFYEFGPFRLDATGRQLFRGEDRLTLARKACEVLVFMVQHAGETLSKDDFLKAIWADRFVEEGILTVHISALRKVLGENNGDDQYIETVPRVGYRFVAQVQEVIGNGSRSSSPEVLAVDDTIEQSAPRISERPVALRVVKRAAAHWIGLTIIVVLAVIVITALMFRSHLRAAPRLAESTFQRTKFTRLTTSGINPNAVISPDGKYLAYVVKANGKQSLWLRVVANSSDLQILPPEDTIYGGMVISPDSQTVYFDKSTNLGSNFGTYQVPVLGGVEKKLLNGTSGPPVSFSPDGKRFAFVRWNADQGSDDVWLANADGTEAHRLASHKLEGGGETCSPAWSPDGKLIVCAWGTEADNSMNLYGIRVGDGTISPLLEKKWGEISDEVWLPDGSGLFITARELGSELFQIWLVRYPTGEVRRITNDTDNYRFISLTSDSAKLAAVRIDRQSNIWVAQAGDTGNAKQITFTNYDADNDQGLSWTPQGQIVYASKASGKSEIWIVDEDRRNQRQLTDDSSANYMPAVTPDGRHIIFASTRGGGMPHLWKMDVDGGNPRQLTNGPIEFLPQVSPDGKWIVYHSYTSGVTTVWRMPVDGGDPTLLTDKVLDTYSSVSPDGKFVSCLYLDESDGKKNWKIAVVPFEGGQPVKLFDVRPSPISFAPLPWSRDGNSLMYLDRKNGVSNIMQITIKSGESRQMTNFTSDQIFYFDWSRDDKQLAIARGKVNQDVVLISDLKQ